MELEILPIYPGTSDLAVEVPAKLLCKKKEVYSKKI